MMKRALLAAALLTAPVQTQAQMSPIATPMEKDAIILGTVRESAGVQPENWFTMGGQRLVRNVRVATLTPVLPRPGTATGAAVVVAPGGAFLMLSMDGEGWSVARWLADHGVAAFVLKYRLRQTPADTGRFGQQLGAMFGNIAKPGGTARLTTPPEAVEDAFAALALVRARAGEWGIDRKRVGMLGFSAGAMTTLGVVQSATPDTMPAFAGSIYGPMDAIPVPAAAPPLFTALADDDGLFARKGFGIVSAWEDAGKPVEFHLYQKGGHGFGLGVTNTTTTGWISTFRDWMAMNGFLQARR